MFSKKLSVLARSFVLIWAFVLLATAFFLYAALTDALSPYWLLLPLLTLLFAGKDSLQRRHSLLRNYPLAGRLRYFFESIRPELRQYFFENELDGKPFNRRQRNIVYQRAKDVKQTISFGMQDDPGRVGYEWVGHTVYPKKADPSRFRVVVGSSHCKLPYAASVLNIGAMSYGALSKTAISALNQGAALGKFAHNTGEGGISAYHLCGGDLIWQIGTGYFGCRTENGLFSEALFAEKASLPVVKMIELKLSQGAKPGHGGLLPSHKNTPEIAQIRQLKPYTTVHSPAAHSSFNDPFSMLTFIHQLRALSGGKPVGIKLCIGQKAEFENMAYAMATTGIWPDFITVDGAEGGTGAAPLEFIDHVGLTLSDAVPFVSNTLEAFGLRSQIRLIASGKIITAFDLAKQLALGADLCYSARGMMFSLGCIQALQCDSDRCPVGIATQQKWLYTGLDVSEKKHRVANFHTNTLKALADLLGACGFETLESIDSKHFFRRTAPHEVQSFHQLYAIKKGAGFQRHDLEDMNII